MVDNLVYGATLKVFIKYEKTLKDLSKILSKGLEIGTMRIENLEEEPFNDIAYSEVLGFELQLIETDKKECTGYQFLLEGNTMDSFMEIYEKRMYDLSCWMARYIALSCNISTLVKNDDGVTGQMFYYDKHTLKTVSTGVILKSKDI